MGSQVQIFEKEPDKQRPLQRRRALKMLKALLVLLAIFGVAQCKPQTPPQSPEEIDAWATQIFNTYDKNGDNIWSFQEAAEWMKNNKRLQAHFERVFKKIDANGDGEITFDEHMTGL